MSIKSKFAKLIKKGARKTANIVGVRGGIFIGSTVAGAEVNRRKALPGVQHQALKEGAYKGALTGALLAYSPNLAKAAAKGAVKKGKVTFRRIRGRLVPFRIK